MGGLGPPRPGPLAIRGLITAVRLLTIVPLPGRALEGPEALGRAAGWFPLVGLALGGLTGDSLGAAVEVGELGVLLAFAALSHLRFV